LCFSFARAVSGHISVQYDHAVHHPPTGRCLPSVADYEYCPFEDASPSGDGCDFFARVGNFSRVNTDELSVAEAYVTKDQFKDAFGMQQLPAPQFGSGAPGSDSASGGIHNAEPPIITVINGDNPATPGAPEHSANKTEPEPVVDEPATALVDELAPAELQACNDNSPRFEPAADTE
jgi:hypothetical protein